MRGRVAVLSFLLFLSFALPVHPQCSWAPRTSIAFRATVLDVAVDGNDLWVATSYGVQLLDRSVDPPALVASLAIPGTTRVARPHNGLLYAGSGSKIVIVRKNGRALEMVRSVEAGGNVNDFHFAGSYLFAATSAGLAHFDLIEATHPVRTSVTLPTSNSNVTSLAAAGNTLYAADGDSSVHVFTLVSPALPQHTNTITSLPGASSVNATASRLYVSDGLSTELFTGTTRDTIQPYGVSAFGTLAGEIHFVAGRDRTLRAVDFSLGTRPTGLFEDVLPISGGNVNRISAIAMAGSRAYVAAGDMGLASYDLTGFTAPYPLHIQANGGTLSTLIMNRVYGTNAMPAGGITEYELAGDGSLNPRRSWAAESRHAILDGNGLLLTANGTSVFLWDVVPSTPQILTTAELDLPIRAAALMHTALAYVLLEDDTLWRVNLAPGGSSTKSRLTGSAARLVRNGTALATVSVDPESGNTTFRYYATGDLTAAPTRVAEIPGAANGTLALGASRAAITTFRGINVVDLATGNVSVLKDSLISISPALRIEGSRLLALTNDQLAVWDLASGARLRSFAGAGGTSLHVAGTTAAIGSPSGITIVAYESRSGLPARVDAANPNRFHTRVVAANGRAYLFDRDGVDFYDTRRGPAPHFITRIRPAGLLDAAATADALFTLASNGVVAKWSRNGAPQGQTTISEGSDAQMLNIVTAGNAVWVAISRGCLTGACEKKTLVFDPASLAQTSSLSGGVIDAVTSGTKAYALFRLPNEMRVYNIADPLRPSQTVSAASPNNAVSVAYAGGALHVLADKVYTFSETSLTATGQQLTAAVANDAQRIRIDGNCVVVSGRGASPELFALSTWTSAGGSETPSTVRSIALDGSNLFVLTDHSLEMWSELGGTTPKKRGVR
ncbi:MAG TPA: hypothetical protein VF111_02815 [Thermoanaerobaculia bacterium]